MPLSTYHQDIVEENAEYFSVLAGKVWHTTTPARLEMILSSGAVLANPPLNDSERWGCTPELYPLVRRLGGISVFDLRDLNFAEYVSAYGTSGWSAFIPAASGSEKSIWIEVNTENLKSSLISATELSEMEKKDGLKGNYIPNMEGAIINQIPLDSINSILEYSSHENSFTDITHLLAQSGKARA